MASTKQLFSFCTVIATGTGNTVLVAAPGATKNLCVQMLVVTITAVGAQTFTIGDGTTNLFAAPASLAVGNYYVINGDVDMLGIPLKANGALSYTATAAVGLTVSGCGYIEDTTGS